MWYRWLANSKGFRFESAVGSFTARKEQRPGGTYWYAYRRKKGKLYNIYLGLGEELGFERLEEAAVSLNQNSEASTPQLTEPGKSVRSYPHQFGQGPVDSFLASKISVPPLRSRFVARPHLTGLLHEVFNRKDVPHLTLISAGAGYGKTTLLGEWSTRSKCAVGWLSLDEADNDPLKFWKYLFAAVEQVFHGPGEMAQALLQLPQTPSIPTVLTDWINALGKVKNVHPIVLVLDDFHFITSDAICKDLAFLIENLPPCLRLIISTRTDPALPLALWRVRHQLAELRTDQLRFNNQEAAAFIKQTMDIPLAQTAIEKLEERTEGWAAGLQLTALWLQGLPDLPLNLDDFGRSHGPLLDYLAEEVLERQSKTVKDFCFKQLSLNGLPRSWPRPLPTRIATQSWRNLRNPTYF